MAGMAYRLLTLATPATCSRVARTTLSTEGISNTTGRPTVPPLNCNNFKIQHIIKVKFPSVESDAFVG